jgi:hypothetical protein
MPVIKREDLDIYIRYLKGYIRDDPSLNRLIDGEQYSPIQLELAIQIGYDRMENTPPHIRLSIIKYPMSMILQSAVLALFEMAQMVDVRNSLAYQDNTLNVKDTHEEQYGQLIRQFYEQFAAELVKFKTARNIAMAMSIMGGA